MSINTLQLSQILDEHLGESVNHRKQGEFSYHCPFCNHYKPKLQVNLLTQKWHCWVCNTKGQSISILLKKSNVPQQVYQQVRSMYGELKHASIIPTARELIGLPEHYIPLFKKQNTPDYRNALHYVLNVRKITPIDILRYEIGYCEEGPYAGMIIVPSYDSSNKLNFYIGRSYYENSNTVHKIPPISKDIIGFESHINWNEPIVLVEGIFDAISTKRNVIPLFGKKILCNLRTKIVTNKTKKIYIALDKDAIKEAVKEIEYFLNNGIEVYMVNINGKDPNDIGYSSMVEALNNAKSIDFFDLISLKINL